MAKQADTEPSPPQPLNTAFHKKQRSAGTGSPIATISSKFEPQQQQPTPKRPGHAPRASSTSSKRLSASAAPFSPADTPAKPTPPQTTPAPTPPPEDSSVAPGALRRSLSFKLPIRVSTDNNNLPAAAATNSNRSRAQSLPQDPEPSKDQRRHSTRGSLSSIALSSIVENTTLKDPESLRVKDAKPSPKSPSKQFLLERGLLNAEELDETSSPEELQTSLQDQVVKYLTTMSSPSNSQKTDAAEQQRAPAYPTSYPPNNQALRPNMPNPGLPVPMPNLSGNANGPVGNLLKGPVDDKGNLTKAALMVGIKLDLEAEVHVTARVRGDILVGLY